MLKCTLGILLSLLLLVPSSEIEEPIAEPFPQAEDSWGRTVWYNHVRDRCENGNGRKVGCPMELEPIVDKPN